MVKFGDIFVLKEGQYVWLLEKDGTLYAARILNVKQVQELETEFERQKRRGGQHALRASANSLFCFVVLTTEGFQNQGAHVGKPYPPSVNEKSDWQPEVIKSLNEEDIKRLKQEIKQGPVPLVLKNFVSELGE